MAFCSIFVRLLSALMHSYQLINLVQSGNFIIDFSAIYTIFQPYIENVDEFKRDIADNFYNQWISNFLLTVDTFLLLGGTVNAYGWFRKIDKMGK